MQINTARYLGLEHPPKHLKPTLDIQVAEHAFLPRADLILADWVATIAVPAFKLITRREGPQAAFCSIGTGAGLDALAAIETLGATTVGVTDVHDDVVIVARNNILKNSLYSGLRIEAAAGDLLEPLAPTGLKFDIIYENLPNIPVSTVADATDARKSSFNIPPRREPIPASLRQHLLALHYLALLKSRDFLAPGGSVLSMLGGRSPLSVFQDTARLAGLTSEIFTFGWKIQSEAEEVITGHIEQEKEGYGPYHFYRAAKLAEVFESITLETSGSRAFEIEETLAPFALSPAASLEALKRGEEIGHTVVALRSRLA